MSRLEERSVTMVKKILLALIMMSGLAGAVATPAAAAAKNDPLVAMFVWWNSAYKQQDGFTTEAFAKYFTPDAIMRINGRDSAKGPTDLAAHFRKIQERTQAVEIILPFIDEFTNGKGDRIFTHHFVTATEDGKDSKERVMGYASIRNGKISLINFVSVPVDETSATK
ncbi:nuclear transport factor 2 family protein [Govanella unica]|uniref:SnoaL-like domain-containing protein n=1 Tax=Govanella unica TaxID=2975056 RepID=A0A9X3Z6T4_9PROT|nr:nuclear transport factor 2 family protein [Govania unica]MDA5193456.1 hypothetical protein [Govania unica]